MIQNKSDTDKLASLFKQALQFLNSGQYDEAEKNFLSILQSMPKHADSLHYLGVIKSLQGDKKAAVETLQKAAIYSKSDPEVYFNLGCAYQSLKMWKEAKKSFEKAISIKPDYAMAHNNLSVVHVSLENFDSQGKHIKQAYQLDPNKLEILVNYAVYLYGSSSNFKEAIELLKKAHDINPQIDKVNANLCHTYYKIGQHENGLTYLKNAQFSPGKLTPDSSSFLLFYNYEPSATPDEVFEAHKKWGETQQAEVNNNKKPFYPKNNSSNKIRICYISPNYSKHPIAYFIEPILENHDKSKFEIIAYSNLKNEDVTTKRLKSHVSLWRNVYGLGHEELVELCIKDDVDILIDLAGHTSEHSLKTFARRAAPIQITYLGYPNTTGLANMDYRITDDWSDPVGVTDKWHTEKLIRMDNGFLCYRPRDESPPIKAQPFRKNTYITFGCFNNPMKVNNEVIKLWKQILDRVPDSKLLLKDGIYSDKDVKSITTERLINHDIHPSRFELREAVKSGYDALDIYNQVDIALDPFPYNGTTTTCEALWMGVPVITLIGESHVSRVSYSVLSQLGLSELAGENKEEYINKAVELALNPERLNEVHTKLRNRFLNSTLTDGKRFTELLETKLQTIWQQYSHENKITETPNA